MCREITAWRKPISSSDFQVPAMSPVMRHRLPLIEAPNSIRLRSRPPAQELRLADIHTIEKANQFLHKRYMAEFNQKFTMPAQERGTAFRKPFVRTWIGFSASKRNAWWHATTPLPFGTRSGNRRKGAGVTAWPVARSRCMSI